MSVLGWATIAFCAASAFLNLRARRSTIYGQVALLLGCSCLVLSGAVRITP